MTSPEVGFSVARLDWDSRHWGRRVGRVEMDSSIDGVPLEEVASNRSFDFLYLLCPLDDVVCIHRAESAGFRFMEVRTLLTRHAGSARTPCHYDAAHGTEVRNPAPAEFVDAAADLAAHCHTNTRFANDPHLEPEAVRELYRLWIRRDRQRPSWHLAVLSGADAALLGYITFGIDANGDGDIGLIGVASGGRGTGAGGRLVDAALTSLESLGVTTTNVVTQGGNTRAVRMYERFGFSVQRQDAWLHWHRSEGNGERPR